MIIIFQLNMVSKIIIMNQSDKIFDSNPTYMNELHKYINVGQLNSILMNVSY